MSENELADKLARRARINEGEEKPGVKASTRFNPYVEFPDMSRKEIKEYERIFKQVFYFYFHISIKGRMSGKWFFLETRLGYDYYHCCC